MGKGAGGRIPLWDNAKGLLIILVVLGHCLIDLQDRALNNALVDAIYFFHMPAFAFISGFFSKNEKSRRSRSSILLFVAYVLYTGFFAMIDILRGAQPHLLEPYYSSWYLLALIAWRTIVPVVCCSRMSVLLSVAISLFAGFWPDLGGNSTLALDRIIGFLPFFVAGYRLSWHAAEELEHARTSVRLSLGLACLAVALALGTIARLVLLVDDSDLIPSAYPTISLLGPLVRLTIMVVASLCIAGLLLCVPRKKTPLLTKAGRNTLSILLLHRVFTLAIGVLCVMSSTLVQVFCACTATAAIVVVFGSDTVSCAVMRVLYTLANALLVSGARHSKSQRVAVGVLCAVVITVLTLPLVQEAIASKGHSTLYRVMDEDELAKRSDALTLLFCGDLILLEDQVKSAAVDGGSYDFSSCFEWTNNYIRDADYAMGVFEGPCAGSDAGYSTSNFDDGKDLVLGFPDEWPQAVRDAGFDFVTTANNHALDKGRRGLLRTLDVLDEVGLDHSGTFRNQAEKESRRVRLVECQGIRLAILAYTMWVNDVEEADLMDGPLSWCASTIVGRDSGWYNLAVENVERDFAEARRLDPDLVIVLPHWGTQFVDDPDADQLLWQRTFEDLGADVILGDHTHTVQPIQMHEKEGKSTLTVFCPGNYTNIYRDHGGDCSAMVEVYVERTTKRVLGGSIIPMWISSSLVGSYRPIPIYDALVSEKLGERFTTHDLERMGEVFAHVTGTMLGEPLDISLADNRLYFDDGGFVRKMRTSLEPSWRERQSEQYGLLAEAERVCFVGDSITQGTMNGAVPWFEPLLGILPGTTESCAWGGATMKSAVEEHEDELRSVQADLFVIALGANDVRYRDRSCALDAREYVEYAQRLKALLGKENPQAKFIFVAPWTSTDGDGASALVFEEKIHMNEQYAQELGQWCVETGDCFVDPNDRIEEALAIMPQQHYLLDAIHPNALFGVELYARAFLQG